MSILHYALTFVAYCGLVITVMDAYERREGMRRD